MTVKRRDFQKAAAYIHEFLLKLNDESKCAELRDTLNLALLHMQKYYKFLQNCSQERNVRLSLKLSARGMSPMTPFVDAPDKFCWHWHDLENGQRVNCMPLQDGFASTTLPLVIQAVMNDDLDTIQELIDKNAALLDQCDGIGRTGIMYAVHHHRLGALRLLLQNGADQNIAAHDGSTASHYACHQGDAMGLALLLKHNANANVQDVLGRSPIHWSVTTHNINCLEILLANGIHPSMRDKVGLTPSMWACRLDHINHLRILTQSGCIVPRKGGVEKDYNGRTWVHWAVRKTGPLECLRTLLTTETCRCKDDEGKTALLLAADTGSLAAARIIVEMCGKAVINDVDEQSRTALHLATIGGHGDVVNFLLEQGAELGTVDGFNVTAWHYAKSRRLHYCQLIIMSHQRQRSMSKASFPVERGVRPPLYVGGSQDDIVQNSISGSDHFINLSRPHPPKRQRMTGLARPAGWSASVGQCDRTKQRQPVTDIDVQIRGRDTVEIPLINTSISPTIRRRVRTSLNSELRTSGHVTDVMINAAVDDDHVDDITIAGMDISDMENEVPGTRIRRSVQIASSLAVDWPSQCPMSVPSITDTLRSAPPTEQPESISRNCLQRQVQYRCSSDFNHMPPHPPACTAKMIPPPMNRQDDSSIENVGNSCPLYGKCSELECHHQNTGITMDVQASASGRYNVPSTALKTAPTNRGRPGSYTPPTIPGVSVDGRHIPPAILAPLQNPPKFPVQIPTSHPKESCLRRHKKKKVKEYERGSSGWLRRNCIDKDIGVTHSPSHDALSLLPPQRHIADLHTHPAKDRNRSSAISCPKFALSPPVCLRSRSPPTDVAENDMLYPVGDDAGVAESYFPYDNKGLGDELMINAAGDHPQQSSGHQPGEKAPSSRGVHGSSL